jgi:1-acyl-sn-glycerol-3-phosphate acyltransferase
MSDTTKLPIGPDKQPNQSREQQASGLKSSENAASSAKPHENSAPSAHDNKGMAITTPHPRQTEKSVCGIPLIEYMRGGWEGFTHCLTRPSALALICFETAFWAIAAAFFVLLFFHAEYVLQFRGGDAARFFIRGLECVGLGLMAGTIGMSRIKHLISPILTYTPAFGLIACGMYNALEAAPVASGWVYASMFGLGLGGGLIAGRTGADLAAVVDAELRDRVFSFKGMALIAAILATLPALSEPNFSAAQLQTMILWLHRLLLFALPLVFVLSWIIDIDIHTKNEIGDIREFPGPLHRFGYRALRALARAIFKPLFHYEPVDARNVPETGGVVLAANHGSFLDPILLSCGANRVVQYVIYSSYYRSLAHPVFRFLRCIPVDEKDQIGALRAGVRSLKLGACIGIFPEGQVSADGKLHPPQRGALFLAQRSGAPVVPVALKGDFQALPRGAWIPRPAKVTPIFGKPFAVDTNLSKKATAELTDQLMSDLAQKLEVEPPPKIADDVEEEKGEAKRSAE